MAFDTDPQVLLAGATGLIGRALATELRAAGTAPIHAIVRRVPGQLSDGRLRASVVDFAHLPPLPAAQDAYCALGTTLRQAGSREAFRAVDHDAVIAFAQAARRAGVQRFAVVSALGADPRASAFYNRVKGETESALAALDFPVLLIARPSLLLGDRSALGQPVRPMERLGQWLAWPLAPLLPDSLRPIRADTVARALVAAMREARPGTHVLDSAELQALGAR